MRDAVDKLGMALHFTRMFRLGLEAMWNAVDALPDDIAPDVGDVRRALVTISGWLAAVEEGQLREGLVARNYAVIRPVSLTSPPPAQALADITAAIGVLDAHGLVIARED